MFGSGKGYVWWMETGVKQGSTVNIFASLNVKSMGLDQSNAIGNLALENHMYPFT